jgi:hypothetical protein
MDQDASLQVLFGVIAALLALLGICTTWDLHYLEIRTWYVVIDCQPSVTLLTISSGGTVLGSFFSRSFNH